MEKGTVFARLFIHKGIIIFPSATVPMLHAAFKRTDCYFSRHSSQVAFPHVMKKVMFGVGVAAQMVAPFNTIKWLSVLLGV